MLIGGRSIIQSKSFYYLGPFQTTKVELLAKIFFFGNEALTLFDWFSNTLPITLYVLLVMILHLAKKNKKTRSIYICMLEFTFPREDVIYYSRTLTFQKNLFYLLQRKPFKNDE